MFTHRQFFEKENENNHLAHFMNAIRQGNLNDVVRILADCEMSDRKALVNSREFGITPLHLVLQPGIQLDPEMRMAMLEALLPYYADIDAKDKNGFTLLHLACQQGFTKIAEFLISKHDANISALLNDGTSCFMLACMQSNLETVCLLSSLLEDQERMIKESRILQFLKSSLNLKQRQLMEEWRHGLDMAVINARAEIVVYVLERLKSAEMYLPYEKGFDFFVKAIAIASHLQGDDPDEKISAENARLIVRYIIQYYFKIDPSMEVINKLNLWMNELGPNDIETLSIILKEMIEDYKEQIKIQMPSDFMIRNYNYLCSFLPPEELLSLAESYVEAEILSPVVSVYEAIMSHKSASRIEHLEVARQLANMILKLLRKANMKDEFQYVFFKEICHLIDESEKIFNFHHYEALPSCSFSAVEKKEEKETEKEIKQEELEKEKGKEVEEGASLSMSEENKKTIITFDLDRVFLDAVHDCVNKYAEAPDFNSIIQAYLEFCLHHSLSRSLFFIAHICQQKGDIEASFLIYQSVIENHFAFASARAEACKFIMDMIMVGLVEIDEKSQMIVRQNAFDDVDEKESEKEDKNNDENKMLLKKELIKKRANQMRPWLELALSLDPTCDVTKRYRFFTERMCAGNDSPVLSPQKMSNTSTDVPSDDDMKGRLRRMNRCLSMSNLPTLKHGITSEWSKKKPKVDVEMFTEKKFMTMG